MSDAKHGRGSRSPSGQKQAARTAANKITRQKKHEALLATHAAAKESK